MKKIVRHGGVLQCDLVAAPCGHVPTVISSWSGTRKFPTVGLTLPTRGLECGFQGTVL